MTPFEIAYNEVAELVQKFDEHRDQFMAPKYQEAHVRAEFLDKFWTALGWDVRHEFQTNPREQEVKIEKSDNVSMRKADYAFYLKPEYQRPVFLVEAKKPSQDIEKPEYYFQTARYGFNTGTSVAVLTDFQEFHIIDCRRKPELVAGIVNATQLFKFSYKDYLDRDKFGEIYWKFSREAVAEGKLKEYWRSLKKPKGSTKQLKLIGDQLQQPDDLFLDDLEEYRKTLASEFKKSNPELTSEDLTEAAQKVLDRLVFIRFLEDKTIEDFIIDKFAVEPKGSSWKKFIVESKELNGEYNGVVFKEHFIDRPRFNQPKDSKFAEICLEMTHQRSPYLFSYIPVEILGSIYERFLGKVVVAKGRGISVEEKPEVRKAGGVYYTPKYIVDYIVENTIGKILDDKTPEEVSALRFADIACGSGSFLVAMFERIVHHIEDWYNKHPRKAAEGNCRKNETGRWILTLDQKRKILRENIFGVDIDPQAVEVAQFSLFLKLLEFENIATKQQALEFDKKRTILPDLSKNIQCGNSLVEYDISDLFPLTTEEEMKIKPFSFTQAFKPIMDAGGFDAIVGNPPWVDLKGMDPMRVRYYFKRYSSTENRMNEYATFMERAFGLLNNQARFGMITPSSYLTQSSYTKLRGVILNQFGIVSITRTPDNTFQNVIAESAIIILSKLKEEVDSEVVVYPVRAMLKSLDPQFAIRTARIPQSRWQKDEHVTFNLFLDPKKEEILDKITKNGTRLEEFCEFCLGLTPYDKYKGHSQVLIKEREFHSTTKKGKDWKPILEGSDITRYDIKWGGKEYIRYGPWLGAPREKRFFTEPRILIRQIISGNPLRIYAGYTEDELYNAQVGFNLLKKAGRRESPLYLLAILNSWLLTWFHRNKYLDPGKNTFQKILIQDAKDFPIPAIDFSNKNQIAIHEALVKLVKQMLAAKKQLDEAKRDAERELFQRKCKHIDVEIDKLVYALYGLTAEEIKIVESS